MSSFNDTSSWKAVNEYTLSYPLNQKESLCEKKPARLYIKVNNLSFSNTISLNKVREEKKKEELYSKYSRIIGSGKLENCDFHVISLDDSDNETFSDISVEISPIEESELLKTGRKSPIL